ncbi:MAG: OsmC family protein [Chloroflexi bacterium]|nr:OsmC family protein [Chloroflexota bacterium]
MSETVEINWVREEMFAGRDRYGNSIVIGSTPGDEIQFTGLKPSDLLLLSLLACSAYDVVKIIEKQRRRLYALRVAATSEQQTHPPYAFTKIHVHYHVTAHGLKPEQLRRAIELAETKYCSVYNTLKHGVELSSDFELERE